MGYIYEIKNLINGKLYIGKTLLNPPEKRWEEHKREMYSKRTINRPFYKALRKYGVKNFEFRIIEKADKNLEEREQYYIKKYRTYVGYKDCNGYNATFGGDGKSYLELNEEEVINYHINIALYIITNTAKYFNVDKQTIAKILKKHNIMWHSPKVASKIMYYNLLGAVIQVDPTDTYIINFFPNVRDANRYLGQDPDKSTIEIACSNNRSHKAYGYYWYREYNLPNYIKKDYRLYNNEGNIKN